MTTKAEFNGEEWSSIVAGPGLAGIYVAQASRGGTLREGLAMAKVFAEARKSQGESELLDEVVSSPPTAGSAPGEGATLKSVLEERLGAALGAVAENATPEELETYKLFVLSVAAAAAKAHKEGGFLGVGGEQISPEEQAALDEIQAILATA